MRALLLLALLVPAAALAEEPHTIIVQEREPIVLVLNTPTGQVADISKSELIRIAGDLLKRHTDFFPRELDEMLVEDCKGRLTCLALKSRRDYNRDAWLRSDGTVRPFEDFLAKTAEAERPPPRFLLMISNVSIPDQADRLSVTLLDLDRALRIHHQAERKAAWKDDVEASVAEEAVLVPRIRSEVRDAQEATTFLATTFTRKLSGPLEEVGHWEPYGVIEITTDVEEASLRYDGRAVGDARGPLTRLVGVRPGTHSLVLDRPGYLTYETEIEVAKGQTARASVDLAVAPSNAPGVVRAVTFWGGMAVAAAGVAVIALGASRASGVETSCFGDCSSGSEFTTFGLDPDAAGTTRPVNPSGVAVVPLGLALAGTGLTFTLGTWLIGEDDDVPWIQLLAGLAVGGATYGLSVLLDGDTPEAQ